MARSSNKYFKISQQESSGTKYLTAASGRDVTLAKKGPGRDFPATQLWEKKEAFFLVSKSKTEYAPVEQLPDRPIELRPAPAMDGLWTESHPVDELIYIQKASDTNLVEGELPKERTYGTVVLPQKLTGSVDPTKPTSLWKMERWEPEGTNTCTGNADHEYFTISPQQSSAGTKYLTASSTSRDVTLAKKGPGRDFPATQLWEKKEVFFLVSKSKTEYLVELPDRPIGLRQTPAMDGLWTASEDLGGGSIYIQKASDPNLVLDAVPNVALRPKRTGSLSIPKPTSLWKMEPWVPKAPTASAPSASGSGSGSGSHPDTGMSTQDSASGGEPRTAAAAASVVP